MYIGDVWEFAKGANGWTCVTLNGQPWHGKLSGPHFRTLENPGFEAGMGGLGCHWLALNVLYEYFDLAVALEAAWEFGRSVFAAKAAGAFRLHASEIVLFVAAWMAAAEEQAGKRD